MLPKLPDPTEPLTHKRAGIARAEQARRRKPDDPDAAARVERLRAEYRAARAEQFIRELMTAAPPLTTEQRDRLAVLLTGASS
jgi:hypothetical protein